MYQSGHSKSGLFLMELIIVILFFSLASTVCIQMFAKSHLISQETVDKNEAVLIAQNLAEGWYAAEGDLDAMSEVFGGAAISDAAGSLSLAYDTDWNLCDESSAAYTAVLTNSASDTDTLAANGSAASNESDTNDISCTITVSSSDSPADPLYTLTLQHHIPAVLD